jgi:hypothetical protein
MATDINVSNKHSIPTGADYVSIKEDVEETAKSRGYSVDYPSIASAETVVKDKYGVDRSPYTSSEELATANTHSSHHGGESIKSSFSGGELVVENTEEKEDKAEAKDLKKSLQRFNMMLRKMLREGNDSIDAERSALIMSISGVATVATGSQTVNSALVQNKVQSLSKIDEKSILEASSPQELKNVSNGMLAVGLALTFKSTKASANESVSKRQNQQEDSISNKTNATRNFIREGLETAENLANQKSQQNKQIDSHRKVDS